TRRMVQIILEQAERAGKIGRDFLNLTGKTEPNHSGFDLNDRIRNVIQLREYEEGVENILVTTDLSDDLPYAWGDPHQMEQVLLNLFGSAEDAIAGVRRRPGTIHVRTSVKGGRIQV